MPSNGCDINRCARNPRGPRRSDAGSAWRDRSLRMRVATRDPRVRRSRVVRCASSQTPRGLSCASRCATLLRLRSRCNVTRVRTARRVCRWGRCRRSTSRTDAWDASRRAAGRMAERRLAKCEVLSGKRVRRTRGEDQHPASATERMEPAAEPGPAHRRNRPGPWAQPARRTGATGPAHGRPRPGAPAHQAPRLCGRAGRGPGCPVCTGLWA